MLLEQIGEGEDYGEIKKVISIIITDYVLIQNSAAYHHRFRFYDAENRVELTDTQEIHVLELPKLPTESDATDLFDWMLLIRAQNKEDYKMLAQQKPEFERVVALVKQYSADELARAQYDQRELWRMDHSASMKMATKQGLEAGHAAGLAEGEAKGKTESIRLTAKNMLTKGLDTTLIAELTGLSIEEIKRLQ